MDEETKKRLLGDGRSVVIDLNDLALGVISADSTEPRSFLCAGCGKELSDGKAYHVKPEVYIFTHCGVRFYLERHLCKDCKEKEFPECRNHE